MSKVNEIAPDVFKITTYVEQAGLQFSQFLIRDEQPVLYETGQMSLFPEVEAAVKSLVPIEKLRWIGFSHFEADECGSLNRWLAAAPNAEVFAGLLAARTSVNEFAARPAHVLGDGERLTIGRHTLQFLVTPYVPHNWASSLLFDETEGVLFCSDLLLQRGDPPAIAETGVLARATAALEGGQGGQFRDPIPYTAHTSEVLARLAELRPRIVATMHGTTFRGNGAGLLREYGHMVARVLGPGGNPAAAARHPASRSADGAAAERTGIR